MTARIRIVERRVADVTILELSGRLELDEGDVMFRDAVNALVQEGRARILLDMREVIRLDSAGIGMLVSKYLTARRAGGTIKLLHLSERTGQLVHITKLVDVFEIFDDEGKALESFGITPAST